MPWATHVVFGKSGVCKHHDMKWYIYIKNLLTQVERWELASHPRTKSLELCSFIIHDYHRKGWIKRSVCLPVANIGSTIPKIYFSTVVMVMRAIFFVFSLCVLVLAAPVNKGDVKLVRNKHLKPPIDPSFVCILAKVRWDHELMQQNMEQSRSKMRCQHPCVVVSDADDQGEVKVAVLSHNHFRGVKTKPANNYAPFEKHPVLGGSSINVDPPPRVHVSNLKDATLEPKIVKPDKLQKLIKDISTYVFNHLYVEYIFFHPDKNCSPDQQLTGVCVHANPDHDRHPGHTSRSSSKHRSQTVTRKRKWGGR